MRDWSRARNFSPSRAEFRRDHERRRSRGLQLRHAERLGQLCEREAGCFPADLQVPWATVDDDGRSGVTDPSPPSTTRPSPVVGPSRVVRSPQVVGLSRVVQSPQAARSSTAVQQPAPDRDLRADRGPQTGPAKRPEPAGELCRRPQRTPSAQSCPTRPNRGRRATPAPSGEPASPATTTCQPQTGPTSPHPTRARERRAPALPANTKPSRGRPQRPDLRTGPRQTTTRRPEHPTESKTYTSGKYIDPSPCSANILLGDLVLNCCSPAVPAVAARAWTILVGMTVRLPLI